MAFFGAADTRFATHERLLREAEERLAKEEAAAEAAAEAEEAARLAELAAAEEDEDDGVFRDFPTTRKRMYPAARASSLTIGLTPKEEAAADVAAARAGRRRVSKDRPDPRWHSVDESARATPFGTATYQRGPGGRHSASEWSSSYEVACRGERSDVDEAGDRGRRRVTPAYDRRSGSRGSRRSSMEGSTSLLSPSPIEMPAEPSSYSARMSGPGGRSLLAGVGAALTSQRPDLLRSKGAGSGRRGGRRDDAAAAEAPPIMPGYTGHSRKAPSRTGKAALPKDLVESNFRRLPAGYTGRRK